MVTLEVYFHGRRDQTKVALTFDDGPNPPRTDEVLEILAAAGARATFFVIGKWVERFPQALERIVRDGHLVGNHSFLHHYRVGDYDRAEAVIANLTGRRSVFTRAHGFDYGSLSQSVFAQLPTTRVIDADVNPADYAQTEPEAIIRAVLESESLDNGSIIDLHDGSEIDDDAQRLARPLPMVEALPEIIEGVKQRGLEPVGLDELELVEPRLWPEQLEDRMVISPTGRGLSLRIPR
jgi:peptidoglycan/xylan/chitin deacetylase (PgdA/CDA1 family)